jgi:hypothetical protein
MVDNNNHGYKRTIIFVLLVLSLVLAMLFG